MFKNEISSSPFLNEPASTMMSNISGDRFMGDCSFLVTLRCLLYNRMPKDEHVTLKISRSDLSSSDIGALGDREITRRVCANNNQIGRPGGFAIHYFANISPAANNECMGIVTASFLAEHPGFKKVDKITEFYRKAFPVVCFINPEIKSVALFVEQMDYRRMHYLQCAILPMVPWYFDPKSGISPLEKELLESLMSNTPDNYTECVRKIYDTFDFRSEIIRRELAGFELRYIKDALSSAENEYGNICNIIRDLNVRIGEELRRQAELTFRINGMREKFESGDADSEIMEYFLRNKNLTLIRSADSRVEFIVKAKLEYFDPEMAERAINNKNSLLYRGRDNYNLSQEDVELLYRAVFVDGTISIKVCAAYRLSINGGVDPIGRYNYGDDFKDCMPHPHVDEYSCMGDYVKLVNELMQRHDYIMALEQCVASARSLNFADSVVLNHFVSCLMGEGRNGKCLELPDGRTVIAPDAIAWLKAQGAEGK